MSPCPNLRSAPEEHPPAPPLSRRLLARRCQPWRRGLAMSCLTNSVRSVRNPRTAAAQGLPLRDSNPAQLSRQASAPAHPLMRQVAQHVRGLTTAGPEVVEPRSHPRRVVQACRSARRLCLPAATSQPPATGLNQPLRLHRPPVPAPAPGCPSAGWLQPNRVSGTPGMGMESLVPSARGRRARNPCMADLGSD